MEKQYGIPLNSFSSVYHIHVYGNGHQNGTKSVRELFRMIKVCKSYFRQVIFVTAVKIQITALAYIYSRVKLAGR